MSVALLLLGLRPPTRAASLDWQPAGPHRSAAVTVGPGAKPGFTLLPGSATGVWFTNVLPPARHLTNQVLLNGSGVAAGDVDGDGWVDLYFCGLDRPNVLYRNLGNWKFRDVTAEAGVACAGLTSSGAACADLDGDGHLDLVVNTVGHGTRVFHNNGQGHFSEIALLNDTHAGMSLAIADLDGDGWLDLYVTNYRPQALMDMPNTTFNFALVNGRRVISRVNGRPVTEPDLTNRYRLNAKGGIEENGEADALFHNANGHGFTPIPFTGGTFLDEAGRPLASPPFDWGLSVMIRDLNQDGLPDIWVCNDFDTPDRIWLNQGQGRFRAASNLAFRKSSHFSMGIDVADIDRDGWDDVFIVDMLSRDQVQRMDMMGDRTPPVPEIGVFDDRPDYMMNTLLHNRGDGTYAEIAQLAGVSASEWSWTPLFLDVDLDGYEDLLISNGHERAARSIDVSERLKALRAQRKLTAEEIFENRRMFPRQNSPNVAFRNRGNLTFEDVSRVWGFDFNGVSHGMLLADLDNDGDQDVVINNLNGPASLLRNNASAPRVGVRLKGNPPNTRGIGARLRFLGGAVSAQSQEMICGGRYLSSDDPMRVFAAGAEARELTLEVTWRSGRQTVVRGVRPNRIYEVTENAPAAEAPSPSPRRETAAPLFQDVSARINHVHHEEPFDDFAAQPSLPIKLSQLGPGLSWMDLDGDGWEELVIGSGKGGQLAVFNNDGKGGFAPRHSPPFQTLVTRDQTTLLKWQNRDGEVIVLAGSANYEDTFTNGPVVRQFQTRKGEVADVLPGAYASTGPLALADVNGDGWLDLFVGGRVVAVRYPEPASSLLFRGTGDQFLPDAENNPRLADVGLVSGAVFSDLDGDGDPDLVLATDWGAPRVFRNDQGRLQPWDWPLDWAGSAPGAGPRLADLSGCWNGVAAGDFNGDGQMDLVATGWGMNTRYQAHLARPVEILYGDFTGDGIVEMAEAVFDPALNKLVAERQLDFLAKGMPFLRERFTSSRAFGAASIEEILGDKLRSARRVQARELRSLVFLNLGGKFLVRPLPLEAQVAPAFGVCVGDLDGDGHEDIFLAQNFFASQAETPRQDGGRGLWLRGDGTGNFKPIPGQESGITVYGEQRGAALADFDHDGRIDLAVAQNGAATKLYRNVGAKPGLRVRLSGPPGNPDGIGAVVRLRRGDAFGPAREIHAGAGYWSQDSPVTVLSGPVPPTAVWVRWPGGAVTTQPVPAGALEVTVRP